MSLYFVGDLNILADKRLSGNDCRVYFALVSFMNVKDGKCYPRYNTIRKRTGLSERTIQRSVKYLAKLQLITIKRQRSTNLYLITRQKILQETIKKRVRGQIGFSDKPNWRLLKEPSYITRYGYKNNNTYKSKFSSGGFANHSQDKLNYKGEEWNYCAEEGVWVEFKNKDGDKIKKNKISNVIEEVKVNRSKKKFNAAAERQLDCA
tara:strand:+ start:115 stop:732 length:618 start_codon:yes stop_codon:yes gene_type:complete